MLQNMTETLTLLPTAVPPPAPLQLRCTPGNHPAAPPPCLPAVPPASRAPLVPAAAPPAGGGGTPPTQIATMALRNMVMPMEKRIEETTGKWKLMPPLRSGQAKDTVNAQLAVQMGPHMAQTARHACMSPRARSHAASALWWLTLGDKKKDLLSVRAQKNAEVDVSQCPVVLCPLRCEQNEFSWARKGWGGGLTVDVAWQGPEGVFPECSPTARDAEHTKDSDNCGKTAVGQRVSRKVHLSAPGRAANAAGTAMISGAYARAMQKGTCVAAQQEGEQGCKNSTRQQA